MNQYFAHSYWLLDVTDSSKSWIMGKVIHMLYSVYFTFTLLYIHLSELLAATAAAVIV